MSDFQEQVRILQTGPRNEPIITLNATNGVISAGGHQENGGVQLQDHEGALRASLHGQSGTLILREQPSSGGWGFIGQEAVTLTADGSRLVLDVAGKHRIQLDGRNGNIWLGGNGVDGDFALFPAGMDSASLKNASIYLDGGAGDIVLQNADCAEHFDLESENVEPGTVMVIGETAELRPSSKPYDKRVAGVISGAGNWKPGIVLDKKVSQYKRQPVALMGKVYCKADAQNEPIEVGDLLTTSSTPGHAMKASDPIRAFGAVIGKALRRLDAGRDLIPILIALQ